MESPTPEEVRSALAPLDAREQKIVGGMLTVMIQNPAQVRDQEWISEQLTHLTLLAGEFEVESAEAGVRAVQDFLQARAHDLVHASFLLFQRVGLDLAPRAAEGFTFEEAVACGLEYLSPVATSVREPLPRDLGEQPLARLMAERGLSPKDLVGASTEQVTHKMVSRAMKGRRLTANTMDKVERAWNRAVEGEFSRGDLFNYRP